ncbi:MAG: hypothetical protein ABIA04_16375 [Pseudomonadota bacterium]
MKKLILIVLSIFVLISFSACEFLGIELWGEEDDAEVTFYFDEETTTEINSALEAYDAENPDSANSTLVFAVYSDELADEEATSYFKSDKIEINKQITCFKNSNKKDCEIKIKGKKDYLYRADIAYHNGNNDDVKPVFPAIDGKKNYINFKDKKRIECEYDDKVEIIKPKEKGKFQDDIEDEEPSEGINISGIYKLTFTENTKSKKDASFSGNIEDLDEMTVKMFHTPAENKVYLKIKDKDAIFTCSTEFKEKNDYTDFTIACEDSENDNLKIPTEYPGCYQYFYFILNGKYYPSENKGEGKFDMTYNPSDDCPKQVKKEKISQKVTIERIDTHADDVEDPDPDEIKDKPVTNKPFKFKKKDIILMCDGEEVKNNDLKEELLDLVGLEYKKGKIYYTFDNTDYTGSLSFGSENWDIACTDFGDTNVTFCQSDVVDKRDYQGFAYSYYSIDEKGGKKYKIVIQIADEELIGVYGKVMMKSDKNDDDYDLSSSAQCSLFIKAANADFNYFDAEYYEEFAQDLDEADVAEILEADGFDFDEDDVVLYHYKDTALSLDCLPWASYLDASTLRVSFSGNKMTFTGYGVSGNQTFTIDSDNSMWTDKYYMNWGDGMQVFLNGNYSGYPAQAIFAYFPLYDMAYAMLEISSPQGRCEVELDAQYYHDEIHEITEKTYSETISNDYYDSTDYVNSCFDASAVSSSKFTIAYSDSRSLVLEMTKPGGKTLDIDLSWAEGVGYTYYADSTEDPYIYAFALPSTIFYEIDKAGNFAFTDDSKIIELYFMYFSYVDYSYCWDTYFGFLE